MMLARVIGFGIRYITPDTVITRAKSVQQLLEVGEFVTNITMIFFSLMSTY